MEQYDEDLLQNPFFQNLTNTHSALYDRAANNRWTICAPRAGSLGDFEITSDDLESHILIPQEDDLGHYKTVNKKEVNIKSNVISTSTGFSEERLVPILFEETYFNKNEESYCVVCVNQPLEGGDSTIDYIPDQPVYNFANKSAEECANLLWGTTGSVKTRKQLGSLIEAFLKRLSLMENTTLKELLVTTKSFFDKAMTIVMKDPYMKKMSGRDENFLECVKLAVETHLMHGVHKRLFKLICTCQSLKNAHLNKITRNLSHIQLQDLGVRMEYCQNVPRARKELSNLSLHRTPIGKINCIKKVVAALTKPGIQNKTGLLPLTTDDLLPIMVFLVLKADMPTWWSHFEHISTFRFSKSCLDNEYGFYMASLEAALEHVSSGQLLDLEWNHQQDPQLSPVTPDGQEKSIWHKQDQDSQAIDQLFQHVKDKNKAAVEEILQCSKSRRAKAKKASYSPSKSLCHPLCSCEKCKPTATAGDRDTMSYVTEHSRDSRGYTVLHMAAFYGHIEIADIAIGQGAQIDATDYLGQTPLHITCKKGHQAVTLLLLHHGAMANATDGESNTPLHLAALNGHDDCAKALIFFDQGAGDLNMDAVNDFGDTALHLATKWGYENLVNFLLDNGASALIRNRKRYDAFRYAYSQTLCDRINRAMVEQTRTKRSPQQAMYMRRTESLQDFARSRRGYAPQTLPPREHAAGLTKSVSVIMPNQNTNIPSKNSLVQSSQREPAFSQKPSGSRRASDVSQTEVSLSGKKVDKLLRAASDGDINMVKFHLGWNNDSDDDDDCSDLDLSKQVLCHPLCQCDKCKPVQKFTTASRKSSVHINSQDQHGYTALHVATQNGHITLMELLLKRGADVNIRTFGQESSPLHLACKQRKLEVVESLLDHGADVNIQDSDGNSPLFCCCMMGDDRKAETLIKHKAQVNLANNKGNTPLHDAVRWNFISIVHLLLRNGALPQSRNAEHKLPLQYSQTEDMCTLLRDAMSSKNFKLGSNRSNIQTPDYRRALSVQIPSGQDATDGMTSSQLPQRFTRSRSMSKMPSDVGIFNTNSLLCKNNPSGLKSDSLAGKSAQVSNKHSSGKIVNACDQLTSHTVDPDVISVDDITIIDGLQISPNKGKGVSPEKVKVTEKGQSEGQSRVTVKKRNNSAPETDFAQSSLESVGESEEDGLTLIDNYFEEEEATTNIELSQRKACHDDSRDSDCSSENSKTESQQDLSIE